MIYLADEILLQILDHLSISLPGFERLRKRSFPEELITLARLCRSSRRLRGLAEPILYRTIPQDAKNRRLLWRTLIERPDLRAMVQSIHLDSEIPPDELVSLLEAARPSLNISEDLAEQLFADLLLGQSKWHSLEETESAEEEEEEEEEDEEEKEGDGEEGEDEEEEEEKREDEEDEEEEEWEEEEEKSLDYYRTRHVEIRFALLLLPKLDLLELESYWDLRPLLFDMPGKLSAGANADTGYAPNLASLREIRVRNNISEEHIGLRPAGILTLPSIQYLQACGVYWDFHDNDRKYPGAYLNICNLNLVDSICNGPALSDMLSRCPALRNLRIEWGLSYDEWEDELDFGSIGDALRKHGRKLEVLELDCRQAYPYAYDYYEYELGCIGSTRELASLKRLTLPLDMLIGREEADDDNDTSDAGSCQLDELLPLSLEQLHFLSCEDDKEQLDGEELDDQLFNMIAPSGKHISLCEIIMEERKTTFSRQISEFGWTIRKTDARVVLERYKGCRPG